MRLSSRPVQLHAEVEPLGPEVRRLEQGRGPGRADEHAGAGAGLGQVGAEVDLVARAHHITPVDERVADLRTQVAGQVVARLDAHFRDHRELVRRVPADVRWQGARAAGYRA